MIPYGGFADPVSSWSHLFGALAAAAGTVFLILRGRGEAARVAALSIFSFAIIFMFTMSGVFHLLPHGGAARSVMCRLDHVGIWLAIAGTFTPIHAILFRGVWRWGILIFVWTVAITALVLEDIYFGVLPHKYLILIFVSFGWLGSFSVYLFIRYFRHPSIGLIILGGAFYSLGIAIDYADRLFPIPGWIGPHEIFHFFVVLGVTCHWIFIYRWARYPVFSALPARPAV